MPAPCSVRISAPQPGRTGSTEVPFAIFDKGVATPLPLSGAWVGEGLIYNGACFLGDALTGAVLGQVARWINLRRR
jgi:hypothetical protein